MPSLGVCAICAVVYVAGVLIALALSDARPLERFALAALWPLGPIAFALTLIVLLLASAIAYPIVGVPLLVAIGLVWWVL